MLWQLEIRAEQKGRGGGNISIFILASGFYHVKYSYVAILYFQSIYGEGEKEIRERAVLKLISTYCFDNYIRRVKQANT